jgi:hypothetical protein
MRRWRHLGLGLTAAKERLALTVVDVTRRTFTSALRDLNAVRSLGRLSYVPAPPKLVRVVLGLIPPHRVENAREATR